MAFALQLSPPPERVASKGRQLDQTSSSPVLERVHVLVRATAQALERRELTRLQAVVAVVLAGVKELVAAGGRVYGRQRAALSWKHAHRGYECALEYEHAEPGLLAVKEELLREAAMAVAEGRAERLLERSQECCQQRERMHLHASHCPPRRSRQ